MSNLQGFGAFRSLKKIKLNYIKIKQKRLTKTISLLMCLLIIYRLNYIKSSSSISSATVLTKSVLIFMS